MPIKKRNILQHELIGLEVEVVDSSDSELVGKTGKIVDETKKTLTVEEGEELKVLPKKQVSLSVSLPRGENVKVEGKKLVARPEERVKKNK